MTFSRQIVSVVTALVLAVHAVVGCCAHHGHPPVGGVELAIVPQPAHHEHNCRHACSHHSVDPAGPSHDGQPCDHSCAKGSCSFLAGSKIVLPDLAQPAGILGVGPEALLSSLAPCSAANDQCAEQSIVPHLRSHLSKCVLLV